MGRITINDIKTSMGITNTYDIINAIKNESSMLHQYDTLAAKEDIVKFGQGILLNQAVQNDFITTLVDRIGKVVISRKLLENPLKRFKKGQLPYGRTIEEIFTDITQEKMFDQEVAEDEVFKREIPDVKVLFHEVNRKSFYKQTISQEQLTQAFTSPDAFENFLTSIVRSIYNSAEVDEYKYMKLLMDNYFASGLFKVVKVVEPTNTQHASDFMKELRSMATMLTLPMGSRDFNALAVHTRSDMDGLHLFIDAKLSAQMDVEILAKAFNMDKTSFLGHVTVIDNFASSGLKAVMVDEDFFMVYDKLQKSETIRNPQGLYWNQFFHVQQVLSSSRFANAVAFVVGDTKEVTNVILDQVLVSLKAGRSMEFNAFIRQTDDVVRNVTWAVAASNSATTKQATTTIDNTGVLKLAANQTGELRVTATVSVPANATTGAAAYTVTGEALVNVIPA